MGNVSLKVLEKSLNFLFKNGYEPCMVYQSVDHGNDITCHAVLFVLFLVFRKKINVIVKKQIDHNFPCSTLLWTIEMMP